MMNLWYVIIFGLDVLFYLFVKKEIRDSYGWKRKLPLSGYYMFFVHNILKKP